MNDDQIFSKAERLNAAGRSAEYLGKGTYMAAAVTAVIRCPENRHVIDKIQAHSLSSPSTLRGGNKS